MNYALAIYTDVGIQKPGNQDSLCVRHVAVPGGELLFAAVCDGMGGLQRGELASAEVIRALEAWFDQSLELLAVSPDFSEVTRQLTELITAQDQKIASFASRAGVQMGSTLTAVLMCGGRRLTVNVGDSRIYQISGGHVLQITKDQSLVEMEVDSGQISREEAKHHPQRNVLLQCIGIGRELKPSFTEGMIKHDTVYLLCSDGMSHELAESELEEVLNPQAMRESRSLQNALIDLTERCKARGETDNITGIAVKTEESRVKETTPAGGFFSRLLHKPELNVTEQKPEITVLESAHFLNTTEII